MDILSTNVKSVDVSVLTRSISFSFYTSREIRKLACAEIFCPVFFDIHGDAIKGGLCDEKMGIFSKFGICKFCRANYTICPGHFGYIDLPIPISNNFLRNILFIIIKAKCLFCNFFKMANFETILSCYRLLKLNLKTRSSFIDKYKSSSYTNSNLISTDFPKIIYFKNFQNTGRKIIQESYTGSIKKKINCVRTMRNHEKCRNWAKKLSFFLFRCKDSSKCFKCGFNNQNENIKCVQAKFNLKFSKVVKKQTEWYNSSTVERNFTWVADLSETISYDDKHQDFKDCLVFQFKEELDALWKFENDFCEIIWGNFNISKKFQKINGSQFFFIDSLLLPPNRFRPFSSLEKSQSDNSILTNPQNFYYSKILKANQLILLALGIKEDNAILTFGKKSYLNLEIAVNNLGDSTKSSSDQSKEKPLGIKQQLEKKNGIFRMHLMGKRVFHSARSIITPDPFLRCNEIGIPRKFSQQLTLPEEINPLNLGLFVTSFFENNGDQTKIHSTYDIENLVGDTLKIQNDTLSSRSRNFLKLCHKHSSIFPARKKHIYGLNKIFRNLINGDIILANRQPSLHRVSIMSHNVKIEQNSKCIKLNYSNCNSYNADFDGDEMNTHVPQNFFAKTEARLLSICSNHFKIPVNDSPTRGLIQDYILSSVILTRKDTFVNLQFLSHLLFFSENVKNFSKFNFCPAILKPVQLWTGKQVISILWKNFSIGNDFKVLESRTKFSKLSFGIDETKVLIRNGELLRGVLDSSQLGKNKFGALHAYYEIYGGEIGDFFLSEIGSILIVFLRNIGYTLNSEDLLLSSKIEKYRKIGIRKTNCISKIYSRKFLSSYGLFCFKKEYNKKKNSTISPFIRLVFFIDNLLIQFIQTQKNHVLNLFSKNLENCIPGGLYLKPHVNKFSNVTLSGAKGSTLNTFQLSLNLGQTELESKCIPRNIGGKTLPVFLPFDFNVCSNGFISNRFLTGITQSEFFFHCMAGREGLLDTAVKTSQSGYIQRSLVKHLESIFLNYDQSVRFSKGQINQFFYSRNGCCPMSSDLKSSLNWTLQNSKNRKILLSNSNSKNNHQTIKKIFHTVFSNKMKSLPKTESETLKIILKKNKTLRKIHPKARNLEMGTKKIWELFYKNLALPGEAIGIVTSQSLGEPCTQMTLNTFHFAGKLASNQKSGIPRLKEILLLSSKAPVTPTMSAKINGKVDLKKFSLLQQRFKRIHFNDLLTSSSHYIEKNKEFEGQTFRFSFQKKVFYKHLLSMRMYLLKHTLKHFVEKFKKIILNYSSTKTLQLRLGKNFFSYYKNQKIKPLNLKKIFIASNQNLIKNKKHFFKINLSQNQNFLDYRETDMVFGKEFTLKTIQGISDCFIDFREKSLHVNGINISALWENFDVIELKKIYTNDVYGMMINYGIEAARNCLFNELESVFKIQGISISVKHFDLVVDYMTRLGNFRGFNRKGFKEEDGFQEITYETAVNYIITSSLSNKTDNLTTVSSRVSLGIPSNLGTGCFGVTI